MIINMQPTDSTSTKGLKFFSVFLFSMLIGRFWPIGPSGRMANWLSSHILLFVKLSVGKEKKQKKKRRS